MASCGAEPEAMMAPERRARLVASAYASIRRGSKSFATASTLCDPATREQVWLLYA
ncbi:MAG TPA: phytoene/squalene synthase family protein, partial [Novosphingobium sp.]|nr:phytoene/squalene synthase family protein [Novosphingobium sp.]